MRLVNPQRTSRVTPWGFFGPSLLGLLCMLALPVYAQDPPVVAAVDPAEVDEWRATKQRFVERLNEFEADTRAVVDYSEAEARVQVNEGFDAEIDALEAEERARRDDAITRFESFLAQNPTRPESSGVRFRLSDLLWERSVERWLEAHGEYDRIEAELVAQGRFDEIPVEPELDLSPSISLLERVIADNRDLPANEQYGDVDKAYYMLGFAYKDENAMQRDEALARQTFEEMIARHPESDLVDTAHLYVATIQFNQGEYDGAIARYRLVLDKGREGRHYTDAMYYLAWSYYKTSSTPEEYPRALDVFDRLLGESASGFRESGRRSDYEPDAIKYMAHSFADVADMNGTPAVDEAMSWFGRREYRGYERDVLLAMGEVLGQYGRYREAVQVHERVQQDPWRFEPDNPDQQFQVVRLLATIGTNELDGNMEESAGARVVLTERYAEGSDWWSANRHNPDAVQRALDYIEGSLSTVAREYWIAAERTREPAAFMAAAGKFREYLDTFPIADDYYEHQWYFAAALNEGAAYREAAAEFDALVATSDAHGYGDGSMYQGLLARGRLLEAYGPPDQRPASAVVERVEQTPGGGQIEVFALSDDHRAFIDATDRVMAHTFTPSEAEGALNHEELVAAVELNRPAFSYLCAQMLMMHNRFDEALPRLLAIVDTYPQRNEAAFAAGYVLDIYRMRNDLENLRRYAKIYATQQLGETTNRTLDFKNLEEGAAFKLAQTFESNGDYLGAAEAFLAFHKDYPKSQYAPDALIASANNYQREGKAEQTIALFEEFVRLYPDEPRSEGLYFRIASNYESLFELERAIPYYESLVARFPDSEINAPAAQYNAAFLRTGLGDHLGAARAYETYASRFPGRPDTEEVLFRAGAEYEKVGTDQAEKFYLRFIEKYRQSGDPDRLLEARSRLASLAAARGDTRGHTAQLDLLQQEYVKYANAGTPIGFKGRHVAAAAAFREVQAAYDTLVAQSLTGNDEKDAKILFETKPAEVQAFEVRVSSFIATYGDFEYAMGALYLAASTYLYSADLVYKMECPPSYGDEECEVFMEIIATEFYPLGDAAQEKAVSRFQTIIAQAAEKRQYNEWVTKAKDTLNQIDPFKYPAEKLEIPGEATSDAAPPLVPVRPPAPAPVEAP
jgi:TolA-binding protein